MTHELLYCWSEILVAQHFRDTSEELPDQELKKTQKEFENDAVPTAEVAMLVKSGRSGVRSATKTGNFDTAWLISFIQHKLYVV
jgi:hypothetical protein